MTKHDDYTVAWVCALPLEMAAAKAMLNEVHPDLQYSKSDHNTYTLGSIKGHNVVITCLPSGVYGATSAATVLAQMLLTFPRLQFGLMVGIGGGVPSKIADIRLGDVVVSMPDRTSGGVIQYDLGKSLHDGTFQRTGSLNKPPRFLLAAVSQIRSDYMMGKISIVDILSSTLQKHPEMKDAFSQPDNNDWLFNSAYKHIGITDCSTCDQTQLVNREPRMTQEPHIHYGLIASGNQVMKDGQKRDTLAQEMNILCFEMEAAGLMDGLPSIVIRGISDYCDSHKTKQWQGYAALNAAAYAQVVLSMLPTNHGARQEEKTEFTAEENQCLQDLYITDPADDRNALKRRKGNRAPGTCSWILKTDELTDWLTPSEDISQINLKSNILWLYGNPGTGKSTMAIALTEELENQIDFISGIKTLAYFFCDSSSEKHQTAAGILRGLLYQLIQQHRFLIKVLLEKYTTRRGQLFSSFDALWSVLMQMARHPLCSATYCIIDALDECEPHEQQIILQQLDQTFNNPELIHLSSSSKIHFLITSRPYYEIRQYLSCFECKDLSSFPAVANDLKAAIHDKVTKLSKRNNYPKTVAAEISEILEEKADGTFLWVGLACDEIAQTQARNAVKQLKTLPRGLHALYKTLLNAAIGEIDEDDKMIILKLLSFVAISLQPLTIQALSEACELYCNEDDESRLQFTQDFVNMCRLLIVIQGDEVRLLHKSVKDFLMKGMPGVSMPKSHATLAYRCINYVIEHCRPGVTGDTPLPRSGFLYYSVHYWPEHAGLAQSEFDVRQGHIMFFQSGSDIWKEWRNHYNSQNDGFWGLDSRFSIFHAAARWRIDPLISWALQQTPTGVYTDLSFKSLAGETPLGEAARRGNVAALSTLLSSMPEDATISSNVIIAAARSLEAAVIMEILFDRLGDDLSITQDIVEAAAGNSINGNEIMALLLNKKGDRIRITHGVIETAAANDKHGNEIMTLLLNQQDNQIQLSNDTLTIIFRKCNTQIVNLLLGKLQNHIHITGEMMNAAARNYRHGKEIVKLLLNYQGHQIQITEDVVRAAAGNRGCGKEIMTLLLSQWKNQVQITEKVIQAAAGNENNGKEILTLLLDQHGDQIHITHDVIKEISSNYGSGEDIMILVLDRKGNQIQFTNDVLCTILKRFNTKVFTLLLETQQIHISKEIVNAVAANWDSGGEIMGVILKQWGDQVQITPDVVMTAAKNPHNGKEIMKLLLDQAGDQIQITEDIIKAAAGNYRNGLELMTLLLDKQADQIQITEEVVKAVVENTGYGKEILLLFLKRRDQIPMTEAVVEAAAGNFSQGGEIMNVILNQWGDEIRITDRVVNAAACNATEIMEFLLLQHGHRIQVTPDLVTTAAKNVIHGRSIMILLLDQWGDQIQFTEDIIKAAVGNWGSGRDIMALLLDQQGDKIPITEAVVEAAAANTISGKDIIELLIDHDKALISRNILSSAASCGNEEVLNLLAQRFKQTIPLELLNMARLFNAAKFGNLTDLRELLSQGVTPDTQNIHGITPLAIAAARGHKEIMKALLETNQVDVNATTLKGETPILWASLNGNTDIVRLLLEAHADPNIADIDGDTPHSIAQRRRYFGIIQLLSKEKSVENREELSNTAPS